MTRPIWPSTKHCCHGILDTDECEDCEAMYALALEIEEGDYNHTWIGFPRAQFLIDNVDEPRYGVRGFWTEWALCAHGAPIPVELSGGLGKYVCTTCDEQRRAHFDQRREIKAMLKTLGSEPLP